MKYSYDFTWKAVEHFLPKIKEARAQGIHFSLPEMLEKAAVEVFLLQNKFPEEYDKDKYAFEIIVIHTALTELKTAGKISYGKVDQF